MAQDEKIFANGFSFKRSEKAPDFVIGRLTMKADEAIAFISEHQKNGWVNVNIKQAKNGNYYVELDTWEAKPQGNAPAPAPAPAVRAQEEEDMPF